MATIAHSFFESHVWAKLKTIVFCAVQWNGKNSEAGELLKVASLDKEIKADYDFIRNKLATKGFDALTGKDGVYTTKDERGRSWKHI